MQKISEWSWVHGRKRQKKTISTEKKSKTCRKYEDKMMKKDNCDLSSHCESSLPLSLFDIDT